MPVAEWDRPFTLSTPGGNIDFNADSGDQYVLLPQECEASVDLRITRTNMPATDGEIFTRRFKTGYVMRPTVEFRVDGALAFGTDRVRMWGNLLDALESIINPAFDDLRRIQWTPTGAASDRALDKIRALEIPSPKGAVPKSCSFAVDTIYPYIIDLAETTTMIADGDTATITNAGNADSFPVVQIAGPATTVAIENATVGMIAQYDSTLPGGAAIASGHYVELVMFRNTAYVDGSGANAKPGIDLQIHDWFWLQPGDNTINVDGADITIISNPAYA